ncbi:hypothetical protein HDV00_006917 [Rhizophlyctis rosea]|nr:hypothetical protein HDV00_006917 [Rhizophlyctis rosea]
MDLDKRTAYSPVKSLEQSLAQHLPTTALFSAGAAKPSTRPHLMQKWRALSDLAEHLRLNLPVFGLAAPPDEPLPKFETNAPYIRAYSSEPSPPTIALDQALKQLEELWYQNNPDSSKLIPLDGLFQSPEARPAISTTSPLSRTTEERPRLEGTPPLSDTGSEIQSADQILPTTRPFLDLPTKRERPRSPRFHTPPPSPRFDHAEYADAHAAKAADGQQARFEPVIRLQMNGAGVHKAQDHQGSKRTSKMELHWQRREEHTEGRYGGTRHSRGWERERDSGERRVESSFGGRYGGLGKGSREHNRRGHWH